ncbi:hypothetical protein [Zooshikella harenae]|uniref:Uncharacterized protein n=1 Tax=Zooshikella harenae TaxID=2827238 RepID=A0ABS5ZGI7_9GAMM|nr:hypothetical protein [Zooshikella harenae]MBU2713171.1 hypothetical protein [Zooshikella harenae]
MSYDLFMKPKNGDISIEEFESYFQNRKNYSLEGVQAWYQNEETGVYFVFEYQDQEEGEDQYFPVTFNMNYFRPSFFVREAEPEVKEFISSFDLIVDDPQINGMGYGEYNGEKFVNGWLHGNEFGYQAILKDNPEVFSLPTDKLEAFWAWNMKKERLQYEIEEDVFVPAIILLNHQGQAVTACVWPDAIPSVIPPVDILLIGRKELAPRKLFKKVEDIAIATWSDIQPLLKKYKNKMEGEAYYLYYQSVPTEIKKHIERLNPIDLDLLKGLSADQVLNKELVKKYIV